MAAASDGARRGTSSGAPITASARDEELTSTSVDVARNTGFDLQCQLCEIEVMEALAMTKQPSLSKQGGVQTIKEVLMPRQPIHLTAVEPDVYLSRWRIFETDDGLKRLVGYDSVDQGRVSSALVTFNRTTMQMQSSDGLTYRLLGAPGFFWDVIATWGVWFDTITGGTGGCVKDVTEQIRGKAMGDGDV